MFLASKPLRWVLIAAGGFVLLAVGIVLFLDANAFRPLLESELTQVLRREVKLGNLKFSLWSGTLTANDLTVADDPIFNRTPFVRAKSLHLGVELVPLIFSREIRVTDLTIVQPEIILLQAPWGGWNFSRIGPPPADAVKGKELVPKSDKPVQLSVQSIKVTGARISVGRTARLLKPVVLEQVDFDLRNFSYSTAFPFSLSGKVAGGGGLKLYGNAGPLQPSDVAQTPVQVTLNIAQLDLAGSGITEAEPAIAGLLSLDGKGESKGGNLAITAKVKFEKLRLASQGTPTGAAELDFEVSDDLLQQSGQIKRGDIHVGKALATLTGNFSRSGDHTQVSLRLAGPKMPVNDLASMMPALGIVLPAGSTLQGGTASANFDISGLLNAPVTNGSASLNNTRLTRFDLGKKMAVVERFAAIPALGDTDIQTLSARFLITPNGTSAQEVNLVVPSIGTLTGAGTIGAANDLDFHMAAAVHTSGFLTAVNDRPIPFRIEGTCSDPLFRPDTQALKSEAKKAGVKAATRALKGFLGKKKK